MQVTGHGSRQTKDSEFPSPALLPKFAMRTEKTDQNTIEIFDQHPYFVLKSKLRLLAPPTANFSFVLHVLGSSADYLNFLFLSGALLSFFPARGFRSVAGRRTVKRRRATCFAHAADATAVGPALMYRRAASSTIQGVAVQLTQGLRASPASAEAGSSRSAWTHSGWRHPSLFFFSPPF